MAAGVAAGGIGASLESMLLEAERDASPVVSALMTTGKAIVGAAETAAEAAGVGAVDVDGNEVVVGAEEGAGGAAGAAGAAGAGAAAGSGKKMAGKTLAGKLPRSPGAGGKMGKAGSLSCVMTAETKGVPKVSESWWCW